MLGKLLYYLFLLVATLLLINDTFIPQWFELDHDFFGREYKRLGDSLFIFDFSFVGNIKVLSGLWLLIDFGLCFIVLKIFSYFDLSDEM